jgi:hypothetical protein
LDGSLIQVWKRGKYWWKGRKGRGGHYWVWPTSIYMTTCRGLTKPFRPGRLTCNFQTSACLSQSTNFLPLAGIQLWKRTTLKETPKPMPLSLHMGATDNWNSPTPIAKSKADPGQKDELLTHFDRSVSIVRGYTNQWVKKLRLFDLKTFMLIIFPTFQVRAWLCAAGFEF